MSDEKTQKLLVMRAARVEKPVACGRVIGETSAISALKSECSGFAPFSGFEVSSVTLLPNDSSSNSIIKKIEKTFSDIEMSAKKFFPPSTRGKASVTKHIEEAKATLSNPR